MAYSNSYTPTNYSAKDSALTGSDEKKLKGSDFSDGSGGDFDRIRAEFVKIQEGFNTVGTTKNVFAALTYDGFNKTGNPHNIKKVDWVTQTNEGSSWKFCRVEFLVGQDGTPNNTTPPANGGIGNGTLNADLNIQVTPFSNADNSAGFAGFVFATVTEITNYYVEVAFVQNGFNSDMAVWDQAFCLLVARN
jgi:hypothetical protein